MKYKVGDLIYDTSYDCLGIITDVKEFDFPRREDEGDRWGYYLKWFEDAGLSFFEYEYNISRDEEKNILTVAVIPF